MQIIRSKRRTLTIEIDKNANVIVRAPLRMSQANIAEFLQEKEKWILRTRQNMQTKYAHIKPKQYTHGEKFLYLGRQYPLLINSSLKKPLCFTDYFELSHAHQTNANQHFERWYKKQAREIINERANYYAMQAKLDYNKIRITSAKQRWGSCSPHNDLSFAWRLVMAPLTSIDYVVVHELAHTIHKNHGKRFWNKVAKILPDYKPAQRWLHDNGHLLQL